MIDVKSNLFARIRTLSVLLIVVSVASFYSLWILCGGDWSILTDTREIRWLVDGDRAFGLLGWFEFLRHPQSFPLSTSSHYLYPLPANIALTDSIPFFAFVAKQFGSDGFSIWHPFGYWLICCFVLQAFFGYLLACRFLASSVWLRLALTMIFASSVPLYFRIGHLALMAHWILLASFFLGTAGHRLASLSNYMMWCVLTLVAATIHPYWPPMVLVIAGCVFVSTARKAPKIISFKGAGLRLIGLVGSALFGFWVLGILGQPKPIDNLHIYTSDILIYFNPYLWSNFLPPLFTFVSGQYEGFAYLGAGILFLIIFFVLRRLVFSDREFTWKKFIAPRAEIIGLTLGCFCLFIWSLGAKVRLLGFTMGYLDFFYGPLLPVIGTFRSVGRFAWALHYLIIVLLFIWLSHLWSSGLRKRALLISLIALILQFSETYHKAGTFLARDTGFQNLKSDEWAKVLEGKTTIDLIPPEIVPSASCMTLNHNIRPIVPLALIAAERGMRFNSGSRANPAESDAKAYCEKVEKILASGEFDRGTAYAVPPWADRSWLAKLTVGDKLKCQQLSDGYTVCI